MAASHGSKATLRLGTVAAPTVVSQDVTVYANTLGIGLSRDTGEVTTMGANSKKYVAGLKDATLPFEGPYDDAGDAILWALFNAGTEVAFEYKPAGSGGPTYTGRCIITSHEIGSSVNDPNSYSSEMQVSGDVARA